MNASYVELGPLEVGLAGLLVALNAAASIALRLGLGRSLAVASVRTVVQLLLLGLVLEWVFAIERWYAVLPILVVMTVVAGLTAVQRGEKRYRGMWIDAVVSVWVSSWIVAAYTMAAVFHEVERWYAPRYAIPLLGIVLGNALNGISIGLRTFTDAVSTRREEVEAALALGATRREAAAGTIRRAVRTGMIPILNSMMVVGIVSLPGMMTGQILSGVEPMEAVKYQIAVMFMIAAATALGTVGVVLLAFLRLFNADHQFLAARIVERRTTE